MRRRELIAGLGSVAVLAGVGAVTTDAFNGDDEPETYDDDPITVETIDAPGSEAGTMAVPQPGQVMVLEFFLTSCSHCERQLPTLREARAELEDDVQFLAVSNDPGGTVEEDTLVEWWDEHGGEWPVGHDPDLELGERYDAISVPVTVVLDERGTPHLTEAGDKSVDEIVDAVQAASTVTEGDT
ncbi:peroxiredoxin family protein [Natrialbaceae archaeon AArc-T1-2]|uniref:peroxiredoxin family protein n=1 Tax=Natrialbaceae archaeon AArc-T1-2 TaxID=3053904 RepID=UPI00255B0BA6|nr:TlpA disulfide reductase family protein [Natrialbaceae archaeon AArc-T1-2]WIV67071.1 TlpA disulfide reductase family protein [Natrialbaceae archaeon AArc-T1-2]